LYEPIGGCARGFALIEILVTLVILVVGLLGLAGVTSRSNMTEMESYQRVQAVVLLQDMTDRLNANRGVATCYSNSTTGVQVGTGYAGAPTCAAGNAQQNAQAVADLTAWDSALKGAAEKKSGGANIGAMIGAVGCISLVDPANNVYLVSVAWQGLVNTFAPAASTSVSASCGLGLYSSNKKQRLVTATVRI
jgi:type IV pilus assembly protein PilV